MPRLIMHIGTEKTGTTSIQSFLADNRKKLLEQGFKVPTCLGRRNHIRLPLLAYDPNHTDNLTVTTGLTDPAIRAKTLTHWHRELTKCAQACKSDAWIVSCELLQSRLRSPQELTRLREILKPYFPEIEILLYIRRPIDTAASLWSTAVKAGRVVNSLPHPSTPYWETVCNHKQTIQRWTAAFGKNVSVRLFDPAHFVDGNLISDFSSACGIDIDDQFDIPPRENETLSHTALKVLNEINRQILRMGGQQTPPRIIPSRSDLADHFLTPFAGFPKYEPTRAEALLYEEHFYRSNEWVRRYFFPDRHQLFADVTTAANRGHGSQHDVIGVALSELEQAFAATIATIWLKQQRNHLADAYRQETVSNSPRASPSPAEQPPSDQLP